MKNSFTKKDFQRMYNVNRGIFAIWCEDLPTNIIKKTKQTFKPNQKKVIIEQFGIPPFASEQEMSYIKSILSKKYELL